MFAHRGSALQAMKIHWLSDQKHTQSLSVQHDKQATRDATKLGDFLMIFSNGIIMCKLC